MILDTVRYQPDSGPTVVRKVTESEIEELIGRLDGKDFTDFLIKSSDREDRRQIIVMGGGDHYVVTVSLGGKKFMQTSPDQPDEEYLELTLGGLSTEISKPLVVSRSAAIQGVKRFCLAGELDPTLSWQERAASDCP